MPKLKVFAWALNDHSKKPRPVILIIPLINLAAIPMTFLLKPPISWLFELILEIEALVVLGMVLFWFVYRLKYVYKCWHDQPPRPKYDYTIVDKPPRT